MTIEITRPETEALITHRLQTGGFKDADDLIFQALQLSSPKTQVVQPSIVLFAKNMGELFARLRVSISIFKAAEARTQAETFSY